MNNLIHNDVIPTRMHPSLQEQVQQQHQLHQMQAHNQVHKSQLHSQPYFHHTKVEGALAYLSEVKSAFANEPHVYNQFLDIMKEFKAQRIDTGDVIHKVSTLFRDHPKLVVGFNSFLPPGYCIELCPNDNINVTYPNQTSSSFQLHRTPPVGRLQQGVDEKSNDKKSPSPELPLNCQEVSVNSSHQPLNCTKEISENMDSQPSPKEAFSENASSSPTAISNEVCNAAHALYDNQPVEFNQGVKYVNKIKSRFYGKPNIYKQFLEILHMYQQDQKKVKEGICLKSEVLSEAEVYSKVAALFGDQNDLLDEFKQFLPDSTSSTASPVKEENRCVPSIETNHSTETESQPTKPASKPAYSSKRYNHLSSDVPKKKARTRNVRNSSYSEAAMVGSLVEFEFFDKVRKALRSPEVYHNFLRCIILYNKEVVPREELINLVKPFLGKFPELYKEFKTMLGLNDSGTSIELISNKVACQARKRVSTELEMEIDYSSCKKCGASYRALPKTYSQPKCSGRTNLCKEVLNDIWVSFPSWSEDSTFVSSRKTQYEEYIYRCEDERFELDVVLETNLSAIRALEAVVKKISRMPQEEKAKFRLDDTLGGTSTVVHQRAIQRIYGDKSADIIEGLKKNPVVAVPLVLRRLKAKEEEWREAQKNFNKQWREQNEKFYLKSLDHQGITFKQNDVKFLRSKNLLNEIETLYEEHHERAEEGIDVPLSSHMTLSYKNRGVMDDAADLIIHHTKRQTGISKDDKHKIKSLIRNFIPDFFDLPRGDLSDDEAEKAEIEENTSSPQSKAMDVSSSSPDNVLSKSSSNDSCKRVNSRASSNTSNGSKKADDDTENTSKENMDVNDNVENGHEQSTNNLSYHLEKTHNLFFVNNNWYFFFRLHHILCDRLHTICYWAARLAREEKKGKKEKKPSAAAALQIDSRNKVCLEESYLTFITMAKSLLDGNIENTQYEDTLREMFGIHAYIVYTIDKVVQNSVRQLQTIVGDDVCMKFVNLYHEFAKGENPFHFYNATECQISAETVYQKKAENIQSEENCFKLIMESVTMWWSQDGDYIDECKLTIELLDAEADISEDPVEVSKWSEYVDNYVAGKANTPATRQTRKCCKGAKVYLQRNIRKWQCLAEEHKKEHINPNSISSDKDASNGDDSSTEVLPLANNVPPVSPMECVRQKAMEDMAISDNTECKFNVNSYKMVFVVDTESYLYKRKSLKKARQKMKQKRIDKFHTWHKCWEKRHIPGCKASKNEKDSSITNELSVGHHTS